VPDCVSNLTVINYRIKADPREFPTVRRVSLLMIPLPYWVH